MLMARNAANAALYLGASAWNILSIANSALLQLSVPVMRERLKGSQLLEQAYIRNTNCNQYLH
jgi:PHD/YefM family antitoxin component YafN of YafNO toxin-antitoxin module